MRIEIFGTGCAKCKRLEANVRKAVKESGIKAEIVKVDDLQKIIDRGVMMTPALVVDGKEAAVGRVPDVDEVKRIIISGGRQK